MAGYLHVEVSTSQTAKHGQAVCGDVVRVERSARNTVLILADGIGSGVAAHLAATTASARLVELLARDFSPRDAFATVAETYQRAMGSDLPFVAFSLAHIAPDGRATVLAFESPAPILIGARRCDILDHRQLKLGSAIGYAAHGQLEAGEGILLLSDGITQAGMGRSYPLGWGVDRAARFVSQLMSDQTLRCAISKSVVAEAIDLSGGRAKDDCSAILADCRPGRVVTVFTGPPMDRGKDAELVRDFLRRDGKKIVCGGTTAKIVQRVNGGQLKVEQTQSSMIAPPHYMVDGVDLATEGAVTLTHVYNIWNMPTDSLELDTGPMLLHSMLHDADRVDFICGSAASPGDGEVAFRQQGIMRRNEIVQLLAERMRSEHKLVTVKQV